MIGHSELPIGELLQLQDEASRRAFVGEHTDLVDPAVVLGIAEAVRKHVRVDVQEALRLAEAGMTIASLMEDCEARAFASRAKANALYMLGQNQAAVELHDRAIAWLEQAGNREELGRSLSASLQPLALLGLYERAFAHAERAREIFAERGDSLRLARLEINFANILHRQDRYREALSSYQRALDALWPGKDAEGIAVVLHNIAVCLIALNDVRKAMTAYSQARDFCREHDMPLLVMQADYNIAALYHQRGEYGRAIRSLSDTRRLSQNNGDEHHQGLCLLDLAGIYLELNLIDDAEKAAADAFQHFEKLRMGYEAARCLAERAIALGRKGKSAEALELFEQVRARFEREQNRAWPFLIDLYQSLLHAASERWEEARALAEVALRFFADASMPGKAAASELLLARVRLETGQPDDAEAVCRQALSRACELDAPSLIHQANALLGRILEACARPAEARAAYEAAGQETERMRGSLASEEQKIAFLANKVDVYERLVALSLKEVGAAPGLASERAFQYMEQARCRSLLDLLYGRKNERESDKPGVETARVVELRRELRWYRSRIEQEEFANAPASPARLRELREQARQREQELVRSLREEPLEPAIAASRVASVEEVRAALPADTCLVEYFRAGGDWIAAVLGRQKLACLRLGPIEPLAKALRMVRFQFERLRLAWFDEGRAASSLPATRQHLQTLYQELIAPLRPHLEGCRRLILVPHDVLNAVPFAALFDGERYLVDEFTVSYVPSASLLAYGSVKAETEAPGEGTLILGIPDERAPRIQDEVESLAGLIPGAEVYVGDRASAAVLRERGPRSRFIHIASHGHFRPDNPMFSGVRLGDGDLDVHDLYRLNLRAELVTLSGCGTALHVLAKGDERLGLERGLLLAGARSVLLTMWDIHDACSALLVPEFYRNLAKLADQADALRHAQIEIRTTYPHPFYWAAFTLSGVSSRSGI